MAIHRMYEDPYIEQVWQKILKRNHNPDRISGKVNGHSISVGSPSFGKTSGNKRRIELHWEHGSKIMCLYDAGRQDVAMMLFPSESAFWKVPKVFNGKIIGARGYPVELLYPVTRSLPDRIPNCGKLFTIPVCDLNESDISAMAGFASSEGVRGIMSFMDGKVKPETTAVDFLNIMGRAIKRAETTDGIKPDWHGTKKLKFDVLQPLMNEGLLSSKMVRTALDLGGVLKDKHTISVLMLNHCPQRLWGFLVNYFLNHSFKMLAGIDGEKKLSQDTFFVINEAADLLREGSGFGDACFAINDEMGRIFKQSRTAGVKLLADTQILSELPAVKDTVQRIYMYNSARSNVDKACEIMGYSTRTGGITADDVIMIPHLKRGWYYLFDRDTGVSVNKQVWTRSRTFEEGDDFEAIYDKKYGKMAYYDKKAFTDELVKEHEDSVKAWELRKALEAQGATPKSKPKVVEKQAENASNESTGQPEGVIESAAELSEAIKQIAPEKTEIKAEKPKKPRMVESGIMKPKEQEKSEPAKETPKDYIPDPFDEVDYDVGRSLEYD